MEQAGISGFRQLIGKRLCLFRRHIEAEQLHRNETVSGRFVGTKDGTERADTNLMQDPERSKCRRWSEGSRVVSCHQGGGPKKCSTDRCALEAEAGILALARGVERRQAAILDLFANSDRVRDGVS